MEQKAQAVGNFVVFHRNAVLSTHSISNEGYPFGSVVPYDIDPQYRVVIFVSRLAEHYKNLEKDGRSSLLILEPSNLDPQAQSRATLLLTFSPIPETELPEVSASYFRRFPESPARSLVHDFVFFRGEIERIRWIGGFGDIRWVKNQDLEKTSFDPVAYDGILAACHMNEDHRDGVREILAAELAGLEEIKRAELGAIDRNGFEIHASISGKSKRQYIRFPKPLDSGIELRTAFIDTLSRAREILKKRESGQKTQVE